MEKLWPCKGTVFSLGHSSRSIDEFITLLKENRIGLVADVRRFPGSRKYPWFSRQSLESFLNERGIGYIWLGESLGGFRKGGYEAHTKTAEFKEGIDRLEELAAASRVAFMCAEGPEARCHRRYIARELEARGWEVRRI